MGESGDVTESWLKVQKVHYSLLGPSPTYSATMHPGEYLRFHPLIPNMPAETKNKMAQMKEQTKVPKIELSDEETANLSGAEFKTLVIRMLTEMVEYGCKIEEKMKSMQSIIKKNIQGTNSEGKETGTQINDLEQKEEMNIQPEQNEETRVQKNEERLRNL